MYKFIIGEIMDLGPIYYYDIYGPFENVEKIVGHGKFIADGQNLNMSGSDTYFIVGQEEVNSFYYNKSHDSRLSEHEYFKFLKAFPEMKDEWDLSYRYRADDAF